MAVEFGGYIVEEYIPPEVIEKSKQRFRKIEEDLLKKLKAAEEAGDYERVEFLQEKLERLWRDWY